MSTNFHVTVKKQNGNMHLKARGRFDGDSASQLINLLDAKYDGKSRVYIDTNNLRELSPFGCSTFKCRFKHLRLPADRLFIEGKLGYELAPEGSKVIVAAGDSKCGCGCNGKCNPCRCHPDK